MIKYMKARLADPFFVMALVVVLFVIKASVKIWVGFEVNSMVIKGDGFHNVADMVQNFIIIIVLYIATRPRSQEYSMGRGNLEFLASLAVSLMLMYVSFDFIRQSLAGLSHSFPVIAAGFEAVAAGLTRVPYAGAWLVDFLAVADVPVPKVSGPLFPYVLAVTIGSILISRLASHYQIKVGRATGRKSVESARAGDACRFSNRTCHLGRHSLGEDLPGLSFRGVWVRHLCRLCGGKHGLRTVR